MKANYAMMAACALACATALAQAPSADVTAAVQLSPQSDSGFTYVCGGIGVSEAAQMKRNAGHYQLMLTFAENSGAYLADVDVDVSDMRGNPMLHTSCDAPILLMNFPKAGSYRIKAEVGGHAINKVVRVSPRSRGHTVALLWPRRLIEGANNLQGSLTQ